MDRTYRIVDRGVNAEDGPPAMPANTIHVCVAAAGHT